MGLDHLRESEILYDAIETFGKESQIDMLIEEMGEVLQALMKMNRLKTPESKLHVEEELADLGIVLDQMKFIFDDKEIQAQRYRKLLRLEERLLTHKKTA